MQGQDLTVDVPLPIRRQGDGFAVEGPGFYVWDEDVERVRCVVRELHRGQVPRTPTQRLLLVEPGSKEAPPQERRPTESVSGGR